jgi:hypothetical protein
LWASGHSYRALPAGLAAKENSNPTNRRARRLIPDDSSCLTLQFLLLFFSYAPEGSSGAD